ncbi:hypothetical protein D3C85_1375880 [compost metagenome]
MDDHEPFIFDQLLPLVVGYARTSNIPSEVAALAAFLSLATVLQAKGLSRSTLVACSDAARLPTHDAPEVLQ